MLERDWLKTYQFLRIGGLFTNGNSVFIQESCVGQEIGFLHKAIFDHQEYIVEPNNKEPGKIEKMHRRPITIYTEPTKV